MTLRCAAGTRMSQTVKVELQLKGQLDGAGRSAVAKADVELARCSIQPGHARRCHQPPDHLHGVTGATHRMPHTQYSAAALSGPAAPVSLPRLRRTGLLVTSVDIGVRNFSPISLICRTVSAWLQACATDGAERGSLVPERAHMPAAARARCIQQLPTVSAISTVQAAVHLAYPRHVLGKQGGDVRGVRRRLLRRSVPHTRSAVARHKPQQ